MTQHDWDDDRIDAAFHARFDRPAPPTLADDIHVRIASTSPARFGGLRLRSAWSVAIAAVVVVAVAGTALVGLGGLGETGGSPAPSDASASVPISTATPSAQPLPGVVFESLPIIDVAEAITIRDTGDDDREIAVKGWFTPKSVAIRCAAPPEAPVTPIELECGDGSLWLTRDPDSLLHRSGESVTVTEPSGPAIQPDLDGIDQSWQPEDMGIGADGESVPTDVVLVGHFDDRRSEMCPRDAIEACRDRFVVDAVATVRGEQRPPSIERETSEIVSSDHDIATVVLNEAPGSQILSATVVDGEGALGYYEPSLGTGQANLIDQRTLWVVRVLESERAVTYIVIDGSDAIYEMNPDGEAILVGGEPPKPGGPASPRPWPPVGARVVELTSQVGAGSPPARVAIVDESGRLTGAVEQGDVDPATVSFPGRFHAYAEPGHPGRVHLAWVGGICDSQITVTVEPDVRSIAFDLGPQVDCDSIGIGRQLVLDFDGPVDVPAIQVGEGLTQASPPAPQGPANIIDCGPLGPDTCDTKAHDIVAANPGKPIMFITFTDECGSYTATFVDGNGVSAIIDCIPGASPG